MELMYAFANQVQRLLLVRSILPLTIEDRQDEITAVAVRGEVYLEAGGHVVDEEEVGRAGTLGAIEAGEDQVGLVWALAEGSGQLDVEEREIERERQGDRERERERGRERGY